MQQARSDVQVLETSAELTRGDSQHVTCELAGGSHKKL
jgi:hypothetical protein